jgi:hypothetical protein
MITALYIRLYLPRFEAPSNDSGLTDNPDGEGKMGNLSQINNQDKIGWPSSQREFACFADYGGEGRAGAFRIIGKSDKIGTWDRSSADCRIAGERVRPK